MGSGVGSWIWRMVRGGGAQEQADGVRWRQVILKGLAANMSAGGIAAVAAEIEKAGRSDDLAAAERQLELRRQEIDRCSAGIQCVARDWVARAQKTAIGGISMKIPR
jgi:hypothetical protein